MSESRTSPVAWIALLVALAAVGLNFAQKKVPKADPEDDDSDLFDKSSLDGRLQDVEKRLEIAEKMLREATERLGKAEAMALAASEAANAASRALQEAAGKPTVAVGSDGSASNDDKKAELEDIISQIREGRLPEGGVFALFQRARELGGLERAVAEMEKYAAAHSGDPDAQVDLGAAYVAKLLQAPDGPERGVWSAKSMAACDAALKIQPDHWGAQFMKSMNLSQWPAFLGRQPEAIRGFEKLIEQQERTTPEPKFAQTYFHLGNTYRAAGNVTKAREAFVRGLEKFPEDKQLKDQLELLEKR